MTLVILAAGMASRFGRLKQIEGFGPSGETIIDYSIYDAIQAGFSKIVLIIREATHEHFAKTFTEKYGDKIKFEFVDQELSKIPAGIEYLPEREKPWGTGHAVLMAKDVVEGPFSVINGDDFYGREAFVKMIEHLKVIENTNNFCMVGYMLNKTLSEFGTVSRGVCVLDEQHHLKSILECTTIQRKNGKIVTDEAGLQELPESTVVSMNFWGFQKAHFAVLEQGFEDFLKERSKELKSEYFIPLLASSLMEKGADCDVLSTNAEWFGVTYKEDVANVKQRLAELTERGIYPTPVWVK
ncbi:MAG: nucleotidyltransferase [Bacteroidales bacterium]|jgi:NDP-sugar pyrophosphorylase family protein|nr:nucleotidyltransferase [Bacteroidales bacterium]